MGASLITGMSLKLTFQDAPDGNAVSSNVNMTCTCATIPCGPPSATPAGTAGAPFVAGTELINFNVPAVAGYQRFYTILNSTVSGTVKVNQGRYDVRWNIQCARYGVGGVANGAGLLKITVAARPVGNVPGVIAIPANIQAIKMK